jgi:hypothetical protein
MHACMGLMHSAKSVATQFDGRLSGTATTALAFHPYTSFLFPIRAIVDCIGFLEQQQLMISCENGGPNRAISLQLQTTAVQY